MQYTPKIALLALALFGTSAIAAPYAGEAEYDIEAREVENDLEAREFVEMYLEAREDPSLDARDVEVMDLEAREYLEYLEARGAAPSTPATPATPASGPQTPLTPHHSVAESHEHVLAHGKKDVFLTKHQKHVHAAKKAAFKKFKDVEFYHTALTHKDSKYHRFAVLKYLSKPSNLEKALANKHSPYHKRARHILHHKKAKAYLSHKKNFKKALKHAHHKYHKDAVKMYLSHGDHFENALLHKKSPYHKYAVHEYLLDTKTRKNAIANEKSPFHSAAVKLQKKIVKMLKKHHASASTSSSSATATPTGVSKAA